MLAGHRPRKHNLLFQSFYRFFIQLYIIFMDSDPDAGNSLIIGKGGDAARQNGAAAAIGHAALLLGFSLSGAGSATGGNNRASGDAGGTRT